MRTAARLRRVAVTLGLFAAAAAHYPQPGSATSPNCQPLSHLMLWSSLITWSRTL